MSENTDPPLAKKATATHEPPTVPKNLVAENKLLRYELAEKNKIIQDLSVPHLLNEEKLNQEMMNLDKELTQSLAQISLMQKEMKTALDTIERLDNVISALKKGQEAHKKNQDSLKKKFKLSVLCNGLGAVLFLAMLVYGPLHRSGTFRAQRHIDSPLPVLGVPPVETPSISLGAKVPATAPAVPKAIEPQDTQPVGVPIESSAFNQSSDTMGAGERLLRFYASRLKPKGTLSKGDEAVVLDLDPNPGPSSAPSVSQPPGVWMINGAFEDLMTRSPPTRLPARPLVPVPVLWLANPILQPLQQVWLGTERPILDLCNATLLQNSSVTLTIIMHDSSSISEGCLADLYEKITNKNINIVAFSSDKKTLKYGFISRPENPSVTLQTWPQALFKTLMEPGWEKVLGSDYDYTLETHVRVSGDRYETLVLPGFAWLPSLSEQYPVYARVPITPETRGKSGGAFVPKGEPHAILIWSESGGRVKMNGLKR